MQLEFDEGKDGGRGGVSLTVGGRVIVNMHQDYVSFRA